MTVIGGIEIPEKGVKSTFDPKAIIDFLVELDHSQTIFQMLEINKASQHPGKMLYRHSDKKMYMLLLYKYPKWMDRKESENPSEVALFISAKLSELIKYFYMRFNTETEIERKNIIFEVQDMLYEYQKLEKETQPQH